MKRLIGSDCDQRVGPPTAATDLHGAEKTWLQRAMVHSRVARTAPETFMMLSRQAVWA